MWGSSIQEQVAIMKIPCRAKSWAQKGVRPIFDYETSGAAPTSPLEGVLRRVLYQEHMLAGATHYGQTRIMGPTGHHDAIKGTAQLAFWSTSTAAIISWPRHCQ